MLQMQLKRHRYSAISRYLGGMFNIFLQTTTKPSDGMLLVVALCFILSGTYEPPYPLAVP